MQMPGCPELTTFFSQEHGERFRSALPTLREQLAVTPFGERDDHFGVAGNTFRAFRNHQVQPSVAYREWAKQICDHLDPRSLAHSLNEASAFSIWHSALAESLQTHWRSRQGAELSFAHLHKVIDLFVKWLSKHDFNQPRLTEAFVAHGNCALDSQSLTTINECLSLALPLTNPSMGDIHNRMTYDFCQGLITSFAHRFGGTRLLFDHYAWKYGKLSQ